MRWQTAAKALVLTWVGALGCQKPCYMTEGDYRDSHLLGLPPKLECDPSPAVLPPLGVTPVPMTIEDTHRPSRYMSLREAIAIALENGTIGSQSAVAPGSASDALASFGGTGVSSPDAVRVLALDPAITATNIERALSRFDAFWTTSFQWTKAENPTGSGLATLGAVAAAGGPEAINTDTINFNTTLAKPLPTGGVAGITFITDYNRTNVPNGVNPAVTPAIQFNFEQPLLQGYGVEINQLRASHPGSLLTPFPTGNGVEGILVTRIRLDQQRAEFERLVNFLLLNVESAYWNLYNAYFQVYSFEEGMRQAYGTWQINKQRYDAGRLTEQDLAQSRLQYETFRGQRLSTLGQVLERERQLRGLLNLPIEDGTRIIPTDSPPLAPYSPDWPTALNETMSRKPELELARQDLKARQLDLIVQKNTLLPDLRFFATDNLHALGSQIDGGEVPQNAFHNLVSDPFNTLNMGLRMTMPLGFRDANATVRAARLNVARSYMSLKTDEAKAERFLGLAYRQIFEFQLQYQIQKSALQAATIQVERRFQEYIAGRGDPLALILAQRDWTTALASEYTAITQYATSLAQFEWAKGTIMEHDNVFIGEHQLPHCAEIRAVEHERQRTRGLVLAERGQPVQYHAPSVAGVPALPALPADATVPLPSLFEGRPPVPDVPAGDPAAVPRPLPTGRDAPPPAMPTPPSEPAALLPTADVQGDGLVRWTSAESDAGGR
jgi:outer membrane protein TolC